MVLDAKELADSGCPGAGFYLRMAAALVRARKERERVIAVLDLDASHDEEAEGCIVEPGTDPIADAIADGWEVSDGPL